MASCKERARPAPTTARSETRTVREMASRAVAGLLAVSVLACGSGSHRVCVPPSAVVALPVGHAPVVAIDGPSAGPGIPMAVGRTHVLVAEPEGATQLVLRDLPSMRPVWRLSVPAGVWSADVDEPDDEVVVSARSGEIILVRGGSVAWRRADVAPVRASFFGPYVLVDRGGMPPLVLRSLDGRETQEPEGQLFDHAYPFLITGQLGVPMTSEHVNAVSLWRADAGRGLAALWSQSEVRLAHSAGHWVAVERGDGNVIVDARTGSVACVMPPESNIQLESDGAEGFYVTLEHDVCRFSGRDWEWCIDRAGALHVERFGADAILLGEDVRQIDRGSGALVRRFVLPPDFVSLSRDIRARRLLTTDRCFIVSDVAIGSYVHHCSR
ncbi:hypothetical protein [Sandaracinus amylolyticus]|nr:hypothetical protein [Sandaracinus amylolyticus]